MLTADILVLLQNVVYIYIRVVGRVERPVLRVQGRDKGRVQGIGWLF